MHENGLQIVHLRESRHQKLLQKCCRMYTLLYACMHDHFFLDAKLVGIFSLPGFD